MQNAAQRRKEADEARLKKKEELMEQQRERGSRRGESGSRPWENAKPDPKLGEFEKHTKLEAEREALMVRIRKLPGDGGDGGGALSSGQTDQDSLKNMVDDLERKHEEEKSRVERMRSEHERESREAGEGAGSGA